MQNINPIDWAMAQYLTGLNITNHYESLEDAFRMILKQYILYFEASNISSRDKKSLLAQFLKDYEDFLIHRVAINKILAKYIKHRPSDDIIFHLLEVFLYRLMNKGNPLLVSYENFIKQYEVRYLNLFISIGNKLIEDQKDKIATKENLKNIDEDNIHEDNLKNIDNFEK